MSREPWPITVDDVYKYDHISRDKGSCKGPRGPWQEEHGFLFLFLNLMFNEMYKHFIGIMSSMGRNILILLLSGPMS